VKDIAIPPFETGYDRALTNEANGRQPVLAPRKLARHRQPLDACPAIQIALDNLRFNYWFEIITRKENMA
jgi:hypothetical protein